MTNRQKLIDSGYESAVIFDNPEYDSAIIGVTTNERVVYDYDKMVKDLATQDNMTLEDAAEFIDYNAIGSISSISNGPIIVYTLSEDE